MLPSVEHLQRSPEPPTELLGQNRLIKEGAQPGIRTLGPRPRLRGRAGEAATKHFPQKKKILW